MKNTTKILVGVGAVALAYYLFKDKFKGSTSKKGDANFSNLTTTSTSCVDKFCPPDKPYCAYSKGRYYCSATPPRSTIGS